MGKLSEEEMKGSSGSNATPDSLMLIGPRLYREADRCKNHSLHRPAGYFHVMLCQRDLDAQPFRFDCSKFTDSITAFQPFRFPQWLMFWVGSSIYRAIFRFVHAYYQRRQSSSIHKQSFDISPLPPCWSTIVGSSAVCIVYFSPSCSSPSSSHVPQSTHTMTMTTKMRTLKSTYWRWRCVLHHPFPQPVPSHLLT
jgi:hypothetical protein